jgi:Family of unknown function (DUF6152)
MKIKVGRLTLLVAGIVLLLCAGPSALRLRMIVFAHHAFNAEYDGNKVTRWVGTVTKVEWTNPHARFYIDVKDAAGAVTNWNFEMGSPVVLRRQGWTRDSLKVGDQIAVAGYPAKDGAKMASAKEVMLADGRTVFGGTQSDAKPVESNPQ